LRQQIAPAAPGVGGGGGLQEAAAQRPISVRRGDYEQAQGKSMLYEVLRWEAHYEREAAPASEPAPSDQDDHFFASRSRRIGF
jgi:hypothetical protein